MQNINIVYKVDSSQIDASNAKVKQAQAATDQLTQSTKKFSDQGQRSAQQFSNTIEGTRLKMQQLKAQIDLTNQSDTARLNNLISQYKAQQAQLNKYNAKLKETTQQTQQAGQSTQGLTSNITQLYQALKLVIGAAIVKQFVSMTLEAANLAGKVDGVERAFKRAFPAGVTILNDLRKATHGALTDFELMQQTLKATNLGVGVQQLPILLEFAAARAQQTGESVDHLVDSIVRGIGRKSLLILDNLGLSATRLKEQFNGASLASQSVGDVTKGVAKIAQEELAKMGGYIETSKTKVDQLSSSWEQLKINISKAFTGDGGIIDFLKKYTDALGKVAEAQAKGITVEELLRQKRIQSNAESGIEILKQRLFTENQSENLQITKDAIAAKIHDLILLQQEANQLDESMKSAKDYYQVVEIGNKKAFNKDQQDVMKEQIKLLQGEQKQMEASVVQDNKRIDTLEQLRQKEKDLKDAIEQTENISTKAGQAEATRLQTQLNATRDQIEAIEFQINREEELRKRRANGISIKAVTDIKKATDLGITNPPSLIVPVELKEPTPQYFDDFWDRLGASFKDRGVKHAINQSFNIAENQVASLEQLEVNSYDVRLRNLDAFYQQQIALAGDNNKAKEQLQKEHDKKQAELERQRSIAAKKAALNTILINTAIGITKAFATSATIYDGIIEAAFVAAEGASQYAIASRQQYAKGVIDVKGPGTGTSDSIPAMISRGESVMTAKETKESGNTLRMIRAKKLNDKILDRIMQKGHRSVAGIGFDDSRILEEQRRTTKAAAGNDIIRKGHVIYEAKEEGKNIKRYIRSKILN